MLIRVWNVNIIPQRSQLLTGKYNAQIAKQLMTPGEMENYHQITTAIADYWISKKKEREMSQKKEEKKVAVEWALRNCIHRGTLTKDDAIELIEELLEIEPLMLTIELVRKLDLSTIQIEILQEFLVQDTTLNCHVVKNDYFDD